MKKRILLILVTACGLLLSGCRVNWFDRTYDVPWYAIALPVAALVVIVYGYILSATYICSRCGGEIRPKWYHFFLCIHLGGKRMAKCPHCGRLGFCKGKK